MTTLHTRADAGLRAPRHRYPIKTPTIELWLHHTAGSQDKGGNGWYHDDVKSIQDFHMGPERNWSDIAYSYLADKAGDCWTGRGAGIAGGHTKGRNTFSHAICAIGNYELYHPSPAMLEGIAWLTAHGWLSGWWSTFITGSHHEAPGASTQCCGKFLIARIPQINMRATQIIEQLFAPSGAPSNEEENDMIAEMIKTMYNLARGKKDSNGRWIAYDVSESEPNGYLSWLNAAYRSNDPIKLINERLRPGLEKETGRKLPSL